MQTTTVTGTTTCQQRTYMRSIGGRWDPSARHWVVPAAHVLDGGILLWGLSIGARRVPAPAEKRRLRLKPALRSALEHKFCP